MRANTPRFGDRDTNRRRSPGHVHIARFAQTLDAKDGWYVNAFALLLIFALLLWPFYITGNEEVYFQASADLVSDPSTKNSNYLIFEQTDTRALFDYPVGWLIEGIGFEAAVAVMRMIQMLLFASAFGYLFSALGMSCLTSLATLAAFALTGQHLVGMEWLFLSVESKTIAYAAVAIGLGLGLRSKWRLATIACVIGTYFHFLVGGFWFLVIISLGVLCRRRFKSTAGDLLMYFLLILPEIGLVVATQIGADPNDAVAANAINMQHVAFHIWPFIGLWMAWAWVPGIAASLILGAVVFWISRRCSDGSGRAWHLLLSLLLLYLVLAFAASYFYVFAEHMAKFYLFRPSSLILLLAIASITAMWARQEPQSSFRRVLFIAVIAFGVVDIIHDRISVLRNEFDGDLLELRSQVAGVSGPEDIVLIDPTLDLDRKSARIHRIIDRPTYITGKIMPMRPAKIVEWKSRLDNSAAVFEGVCARAPDGTRLLVILSRDPSHPARRCGNVIWTSGDISLVELPE